MIILRNTALAAALASAAAMTISAPAQAQAVKGVAVVNEEKLLQGSTARAAAEQQIATQYAQDIQVFQQTQQSISAQLKPLIDQFDAERAKPQPNRQVLENLAVQINDLQQQGEATLTRIGQPIALARNYVGEQLSTRIRAAIATVAGRRQVTIVVSEGTTFFASPSIDITNDVIAELNRDTSPIPVVPTPQWLQSKGIGQPGATQPAAQPVTPQPEGR